MRYRVELSEEAQKQLFRLPRDVRERMERAINELEEKADSHWSNIKALQGAQWKGKAPQESWSLPDHFHEIPKPWRS